MTAVCCQALWTPTDLAVLSQSLPSAAYVHAESWAGWLGWRHGIGDPTRVAWLNTLLYLTAGAACLAVRRGTRCSQERRIWTASGFTLIFLGANKQLDFQTAFIGVVKLSLSVFRLYDHRLLLTVIFVLLLGIGAVAALVAMMRWLRGSSHAAWLAVAGLYLTLAYALLRAATFGRFDRILGFYVPGGRSGWLMELTGLLLVLGAASRRYRAQLR